MCGADVGDDMYVFITSVFIIILMFGFRDGTEFY